MLLANCSQYIIGQCLFHLAPPPSPPKVQGLCSLVVWYSPAVSCEGISGYEVRLYSPQSVHQNVTRHVGANGTFYIIKDEDKLAVAETYVQVCIYSTRFDDALMFCDSRIIQVRVVQNSGVGDWSRATPIGKSFMIFTLAQVHYTTMTHYPGCDSKPTPVPETPSE